MNRIGLSKPVEQKVRKKRSVGDKMPSGTGLTLQKDYLFIAFLRHIGCPFAEATVTRLRGAAQQYPEVDFLVVGHGEESIARQWLQLIGGLGDLRYRHDPDRELYGRWGLGYSDWQHFLGKQSLTGALSLLREGVKNRMATGTRWQKAGAFLLDKQGIIRWKHAPESADELPDLELAMQSVMECVAE